MWRGEENRHFSAELRKTKSRWDYGARRGSGRLGMSFKTGDYKPRCALIP